MIGVTGKQARSAGTAVAGALVAVSAMACGLLQDSGEAEVAGSSWVGTVNTEGDVTTVVNESGSVWGGAATLVEELSIGVDVGDDPYMLGDVGGIAEHERHIYVLDRDIPTVRVYDEAGVHIRDIGRAGEGPGEFRTGFQAPVGLAFDEVGRLYVHARSKIEIFDAEGRLLDTWNLDRSRAQQGSVALVVPRPGLVLLAERAPCDENIRSRCGMAVRSVEEGVLATAAEPIPDLGYHQPDAAIEIKLGQSISWFAAAPPFVPALVWTIGPNGDVLVGRADRYEFERHGFDGAVSRVSRYWAPVPVLPDERDWYLRRERLNAAREGATYVGTYDLGQGLPAHKPAFREMIATRDGGVWLLRAGPGENLVACDEDAADANAMRASPCWRDTSTIDAFGPDGRFLGTIEIPEIFDARGFPVVMRNLNPFIRDDQVFVAVEDEAGTIMVKRYRLVLPGVVR